MHNQVLRQILIEVRLDAYNEVPQKKKEAEITILHISGCFFLLLFLFSLEQIESSHILNVINGEFQGSDLDPFSTPLDTIPI